MANLSISANRQIARAAATVMAAFILSNLVGLVCQILVTRQFGTQAVIDAFNAAATFPDLLFSLIAGGALASAFVPTVTDFLSKGERKNAWFLSSAIGNLVFIILTTLSLLAAIRSPWIVQNILAPRFDPQQQALTSSLLRVLLISPTLFGISGLIMGILNAHQVFLWPALAPTMYWLGMIFGVLFLAPSMGIYGLAWGAVLGAVMHLAIQLPALLRLPGRSYFPSLGLRFPAVREVGRLMAPRLLGVAAVQMNFVVNTILATGQPVGSLTSIKYAWAVMTMPQVVIAQAIAIAALPTFSNQVARGQMEEMRSSLAATLRGVLLLALPATLGLVLLRVPIIGMLFQRGEFDSQSTQMVAWALLWYALGLVGHSFVEIISRAFYAMHNTLTPVIVSVGAMSLNVAFSIAFSNLFLRIGWAPHGGLALANTLATTLEMAALVLLMSRRMGGIGSRQIYQAGWQTALATLAMSLGVIAWLQVTKDEPYWIVATGGILIGGILFVLTALAVGIREVRSTATEVLQKLKR
ncbi:MAG: murein biosynthesis integral membrane protein MurJ [Anaerolineales bacterium]